MVSKWYDHPVFHGLTFITGIENISSRQTHDIHQAVPVQLEDYGLPAFFIKKQKGFTLVSIAFPTKYIAGLSIFQILTNGFIKVFCCVHKVIVRDLIIDHEKTNSLTLLQHLMSLFHVLQFKNLMNRYLDFLLNNKLLQSVKVGLVLFRGKPFTIQDTIK